MSETRTTRSAAPSQDDAPRSRVWVGDRVLADDADEPQVAELLRQHDDASAWAVIEPTDTDRIDGLIARFDLDEWVRHDLTSNGVRPLRRLGSPYGGKTSNPGDEPRPQVKYEEFDRVRLVITAAVEMRPGFAAEISTADGEADATGDPAPRARDTAPDRPSDGDPESEPDRGAGSDRSQLTTRRVALVITPRLLLVVAQPEDGRVLSRHLDNLQARLAEGGSERAAQGVLHALTASYFVVVQAIQDASDDLADSLFDLQPLTKQEKGRAFRLRRAVTELRRVTGPMREIVQSLGQSSSEDPGSISRSWNLLIEHQVSVSEAADDLRDSLGALFDTSLAFDDSRMNEVMKKLTGWAAIVAAPTLVTGFVGMNVPFWGDGHVYGFYIYLSVMAAACVSLYVLFKRLDWI